VADLERIARELYARPLGEFTTARTALAREHPDSAADIRALRKPTVAAWVVTALVTHAREEFDDLLTLAEQLRAAQDESDRETLREVGRRRRELLRAVARHAGQIAEGLGQTVTPATLEEVEQTLQAAMSDPDAADAVGSGRLARPLVTEGFQPVDLSGAVAASGTAPAPRRAAPAPGHARGEVRSRRDEVAAKRREVAERAVAEATRTLEELRSDAEDAEGELHAASDRRESVDVELEEARERVDRVQGELVEAERAVRSARLARASVQRDVERAEAALEKARRAVERL
jgi:hypothetical protein